MADRALTSVQVDVLDLLDSGLEARGIGAVFRDRALRTVAWAVIR